MAFDKLRLSGGVSIRHGRITLIHSFPEKMRPYLGLRSLKNGAFFTSSTAQTAIRLIEQSQPYFFARSASICVIAFATALASSAARTYPSPERLPPRCVRLAKSTDRQRSRNSIARLDLFSKIGLPVSSEIHPLPKPKSAPPQRPTWPTGRGRAHPAL